MEDQYILTLKFSDETEPDIIGISELLYDLNMAYEYSYLKKYGNDNSIAVDELLDTLHFYPVRHRRRRFSKIFGPEHQLKALAIRKESPLLIEVIAPTHRSYRATCGLCLGYVADYSKGSGELRRHPL